MPTFVRERKRTLDSPFKRLEGEGDINETVRCVRCAKSSPSFKASNLKFVKLPENPQIVVVMSDPSVSFPYAFLGLKLRVGI